MLSGPPTACPDPEVLQDLAAGTLAQEQLEQALAHVDRCETCRATIAAIATEGTPRSAAALSPLAATFQPGELVGRYRIDGFVGRGGMGEVYDAFDTVLIERVALKTLTGELMDEPEAIPRMRSEVQLAHRVSHRNVCRVRDFGLHVRPLPAGRSETVPYLTMEFLEGPTLHAVIRDQGLRGQSEPVEVIFRQICEGLAAIHEAGILHRDLKSENVILTTATGGKRRAVVTDFGLAREWQSARRSLSGSRLAGTAGYMSPEQVLGQPLAPSTDVYALGVVLFEMLTGRLPFEAETAIALAAKRLHEAPPAPSTIDPGVGRPWDRLVLRCLSRDQAGRPASVQEVVQLIPAATGHNPAVTAPGRRGIAVALGLGALAAGIVALRSSWQSAAPGPVTAVPEPRASPPDAAIAPPAEFRPAREEITTIVPPTRPPPRPARRARPPATPAAPAPLPPPPATGSQSGRDRLLDPFQQGSP